MYPTIRGCFFEGPFHHLEFKRVFTIQQAVAASPRVQLASFHSSNDDSPTSSPPPPHLHTPQEISKQLHTLSKKKIRIYMCVCMYI